jgi:23S rRNA (guanosine2251-2'-O)-methyltransferase
MAGAALEGVAYGRQGEPDPRLLDPLRRCAPVQWEVIAGIHPVLEALRAGREVKRLLVAKGREDARVDEVMALAKERGVGVERAPKSRLDDLYQGNHQGVMALLVPQGYATLEDALALAKQRGQDPFLIALDGVEDPHNLGAVVRTAEAAGAHGLIIPERGSASLTPVVHKASAGATQRLPVIMVPNLGEALRTLKRDGLWIGGAVEDAPAAHYDTKLTGPLVLCLGAEGEGLRRLTRDLCDFVVKVPMQGSIGSLNVSAAAAVLCFERVRQAKQGRGAKGEAPKKGEGKEKKERPAPTGAAGQGR